MQTIGEFQQQATGAFWERLREEMDKLDGTES